MPPARARVRHGPRHRGASPQCRSAGHRGPWVPRVLRVLPQVLVVDLASARGETGRRREPTAVNTARVGRGQSSGLWPCSNEGPRRLASSFDLRGRADRMASGPWSGPKGAEIIRTLRHRNPTRAQLSEDCRAAAGGRPPHGRRRSRGTPGPGRRVPLHRDRACRPRRRHRGTHEQVARTVVGHRRRGTVILAPLDRLSPWVTSWVVGSHLHTGRRRPWRKRFEQRGGQDVVYQQARPTSHLPRATNREQVARLASGWLSGWGTSGMTTMVTEPSSTNVPVSSVKVWVNMAVGGLRLGSSRFFLRR